MEEPVIHVAVLVADEIRFELHGDFTSSQDKNNCSGKYAAKIEDGKIVVSDNNNETVIKDDTITFDPDNFEAESFIVRDVIIGIQFHWQQKENQRFQGSLKLLIEKGKIAAVNIVPAESYLTSVISSEMSATSSTEFLKAHAIISRSWLFAQIDKSNELRSTQNNYNSSVETDEELIKWYDREDHTLYDVCADDHCQRYQGITKLYAHNAQTAVADTRGLVLKYNNKICDTRFSKSCGGVSESFENVWEPVEHPYLASIIDYKFEQDAEIGDLRIEENAAKWIANNPPAFCNTQDENILSQVLLDYDQETRDFYRWKVEYSNEELSELIKGKSGIDFGEIIDLVPIERGYSGRLIKLNIIGSKKKMIIGKELEIRRFLSTSHLYSSAFIVEKENVKDGIPGKIILRGAGWGHGVGLCQIGAAVMSEMGHNFDEILLHYFRNAKIEKIY